MSAGFVGRDGGLAAAGDVTTYRQLGRHEVLQQAEDVARFAGDRRLVHSCGVQLEKPMPRRG